MALRAFITGISGQDGYYLTSLLLEKGYSVMGLVRRHSSHESEFGNVACFTGEKFNRIEFVYGDVTDVSSIESALHRFQPHEIYNLAAQSHVRVSFDMPQFTMQVNAMGTLNMLEATRKIVPHARFYQASTSEMFGNQISMVDSTLMQTMDTPMIPVSPYGISKLVGHNLVNQYRTSYGMFCCSGILFNHESPFRGGNFVTQKIIRGALRIKHGLQEKLQLGNLNAIRDWGHAEDYVNAMWLMLQQTEPRDYIVATGESYSIKEFAYHVFSKLNMNWEDHIEIQDFHKRPEDVEYLRGDARTTQEILEWKRKYNIHSLIDDMIDAEEYRIGRSV